MLEKATKITPKRQKMAKNAKNHPKIAIKRKIAKNPAADFSDGFRRWSGLKNKNAKTRETL